MKEIDLIIQLENARQALKDILDSSNRMTTGNLGHSRVQIISIATYGLVLSEYKELELIN